MLRDLPILILLITVARLLNVSVFLQVYVTADVCHITIKIWLGTTSVFHPLPRESINRWTGLVDWTTGLAQIVVKCLHVHIEAIQ